MGKKSIKSTRTNNKSNIIVASRPLSQPVSFNFKRLKVEGRKFNYEDKETEYFCKLMDRLKNVSSLTKMELLQNRGKTLRCHQIDFRNDTRLTETTFGILSDAVDDEAYQISISSNEHGRVHGYFVGDIFYIVWFDPEHELYI